MPPQNPPVEVPMKKISALALLTLFLFTLGSENASAQSGRKKSGPLGALFNYPSIEQAWQAAVSADKPLLVMFTTDHCVYCRKMLSETYSHPAIQKMLASRAETVMANAKDYRALTKRMGIRGYPSTLVISPQGQVLDLVEGYMDAQKFAKRVGPLLAKQTTRIGKATSAPANLETIER